jgi:hypothetical protein
MKKTFFLLYISCFFSLMIYAQKIESSSTGPVPRMKIEKVQQYKFREQGTALETAYGHSSFQNYTLSMPIPAGTPFTILSSWTPPVFASSMVNERGTSYYYITEVGPPAALYKMDSEIGVVTLVGNITGMGSDQPNGIAYNTENNTYYICSSANLYSFNLTTRVATLIGPFNTGGLMIDLCFDWSGVCYTYDVGTDNAYTINITTGNATLLGPLGYDANYGQGMSYDYETNTIYLSAFNNTSVTGQLRTMNPQTGMTSLITDWGFEQIAPFSLPGIPCMSPVGQPTNLSPPYGATNIPVSGVTLEWINGAYTVNVEVWFGPVTNAVKVYDGPAITSWTSDALLYNTNYKWFIVDKDTICGGAQGNTWIFTTEQNPSLDSIYVYPMNIDYWTGTCDSVLKTEVSLVKAIGNNVGWMVFDLTSIPDYKVIQEVTFYGYVYSNNWPYWSITPMNSIVPMTDNAPEIFNQISTHYQQGIAYNYNQEPGTLPNGWLSKDLETNALGDLQAALPQDYFAIGIVDFDFNSAYYIDFQGWSESNKPYLIIEYDECLEGLNPPSNLTGQVIYNPDPQVQLNWQDNSGEEGFKIYRKAIIPNQQTFYKLIGTVSNSTTQFLDTTVFPESEYGYRVFAFNICGSSGSDTLTITVPIPVELVSFTAEIDDIVVTLFWQTATETNNLGFEVQRLQNSKIEKLQEWKTIAFVPGFGTTTEPRSYSFVDEDVATGKYKYRLKQIDLDGSFEYSQEVEAEVKAPNVFSLEQNYPNPFNPTTKIKYTIPVVETHRDASLLVTLKVYDILGNEVATLVNEEQEPGVYEVEFSTESSFRLVRNLTSGIYFYQLRAGEFNQTKKMILLR